MITLEYGKSGYSGYGRDYPDYLHDHNAVQRVIDGLDEGDEYTNECEYGGYQAELSVISKRDNTRLFKATCPQKVEAILKATGLWQPEETT